MGVVHERYRSEIDLLLLRLLAVLLAVVVVKPLWVTSSVNFYVNMLGADYVRRPLQATNIRGDDVQNMLFQKEMLDAERLHVHPQNLGVANISDRGNMRLDHR